MLLPYYLSHRNCVKIIQNYTTFVINTVTNTTYPVAMNLRDDRILCNTTVKTIFVKTFYCLVDKGVIFVVDTGMILPYYVRRKEWFQGFNFALLCFVLCTFYYCYLLMTIFTEKLSSISTKVLLYLGFMTPFDTKFKISNMCVAIA